MEKERDIERDLIEQLQSVPKDLQEAQISTVLFEKYAFYFRGGT